MEAHSICALMSVCTLVHVLQPPVRWLLLLHIILKVKTTHRYLRALIILCLWQSNPTNAAAQFSHQDVMSSCYSKGLIFLVFESVVVKNFTHQLSLRHLYNRLSQDKESELPDDDSEHTSSLNYLKLCDNTHLLCNRDYKWHVGRTQFTKDWWRFKMKTNIVKQVTAPVKFTMVFFISMCSISAVCPHLPRCLFQRFWRNLSDLHLTHSTILTHTKTHTNRHCQKCIHSCISAKWSHFWKCFFLTETEL